MRDSSTGRSRGFGFLTFKDAKTVNIVMVKEHFLDGKIVSKLQQHVPPPPRKTIHHPNINLWGLDHTTRLTPNEPFPEMNKKRRAKFLSAALVKKRQTRNSGTTLLNSGELSTQRS